ncbi:MAG: hypothetical protein AAF986_07540, partial [Pseudomonadota bacterium]
MADFLLTLSPTATSQDVTEAMITTPYAQKIANADGAVKFAVSRVDSPDMWFPASSEEAGATVFIGGRMALSALEWDATVRLPYQGGLAARHLLHQWLQSDKRNIPNVNGAAVAVFLDHKAGTGFVRTDRVGWAPALMTAPGRPLTIGSHPDAIARIVAQTSTPLPLDELTIAEFIKTGESTHPYTYYNGLSLLDPGSVYRFDLSHEGHIEKVDTHWTPSVLTQPPAPRAQFVEALAEGIKKAGKLRSSSHMGTPAVLLSAGADSRGVLCALNDPPSAKTFVALRGLVDPLGL